MGRPFSFEGFVSGVVVIETGCVTVSIVMTLLLLAIPRAMTASGMERGGVVGEQVVDDDERSVSAFSEYLESRVEAEWGVVGVVGVVVSEMEPLWVRSWTEERRLMTSRAIVLRRRSMLRGCWLASKDLNRFGEIIVVMDVRGWGEKWRWRKRRKRKGKCKGEDSEDGGCRKGRKLYACD